MLKVKDLSKDSALPKEFLDILPKECDICGADTEITETLTMLCCSNKKCPEKAVQRLVALLKDIGVKNMGESKCRSFLSHFGTTNPYAVFMYEPDEDGVLYDGCSEDFSYGMFEQVDKKREMLLWEFVKIGNLPGIRDSARKLLIEYDDLDEFYDDLEAGGIAFVQDLLSIKGKKSKSTDAIEFFDDDDIGTDVVSVKAVDTYNTLMYFKDELMESVGSVDIMSLETDVINMCISTAVGKPFKSKSDFVAQMNDKFKDKVHLNFLGSVTKDCQYLIWSKEGSKTSKVKKAEKYGIPVMTGIEFEEFLDKL